MHLYVYSPSGAVRDKAAFKRGLAVLKARGYEVEVDTSALKSHQRFAGDDETRLAAITRAAASGADAALITRGGYGLTRLLGHLPYKHIAKAAERGMHWVGFSDFTAFQSAVLAKTGTLTWAGPALGEDFGAEPEADDIMLDCFDDLMHGRGEGCGWRLPANEAVAKEQMIKDAPLWGGNLSVLVALLGTLYFPQMEGGVLFLEDVNETPYRIERMLWQLLHAGVLAKQKAIVLGQFSGAKTTPHDQGFTLKTVVADLRKQLKRPVLTGLPFGHVATKVLLPVGAKVSLALEGRDAFLLWGHLSHHGHGHHDH